MRFKVGDRVRTNLLHSSLSGLTGEITSVNLDRSNGVFPYYVKIDKKHSRFPRTLGFDENELESLVVPPDSQSETAPGLPGEITTQAPGERGKGPVGLAVLSNEDKELIDKVLTEKLRTLHSKTKNVRLPEEGQDFESLMNEMVAILGVLARLGEAKSS